MQKVFPSRLLGQVIRAHEKTYTVVIKGGGSVVLVITIIQSKKPTEGRIEALGKFAKVTVGEEAGKYVISIVKKTNLAQLPQDLYSILSILNLREKIAPPHDFLDIGHYVDILESSRPAGLTYSITYRASKPIKVTVVTVDEKEASDLQDIIKLEKKEMSENKYYKLIGMKGGDKNKKVTVFIAEKKFERYLEFLDFMQELAKV